MTGNNIESYTNFDNDVGGALGEFDYNTTSQFSTFSIFKNAKGRISFMDEETGESTWTRKFIFSSNCVTGNRPEHVTNGVEEITNSGVAFIPFDGNGEWNGEFGKYQLNYRDFKIKLNSEDSNGNNTGELSTTIRVYCKNCASPPLSSLLTVKDLGDITPIN